MKVVVMHQKTKKKLSKRKEEKVVEELQIHRPTPITTVKLHRLHRL